MRVLWGTLSEWWGCGGGEPLGKPLVWRSVTAPRAGVGSWMLPGRSVAEPLCIAIADPRRPVAGPGSAIASARQSCGCMCADACMRCQAGRVCRTLLEHNGGASSCDAFHWSRRRCQLGMGSYSASDGNGLSGSPTVLMSGPPRSESGLTLKLTRAQTKSGRGKTRSTPHNSPLPTPFQTANDARIEDVL